MTESFDAEHGLVIVRALLWGPTSNAVARLALDTGASRTLINTRFLLAMGYQRDRTENRIQITTGSGIEFVPRLRLKRLTALEKSLRDFSVLCHSLPPTAAVDGLLGLDLLRRRRLTLDFRRSTVTLT